MGIFTLALPLAGVTLSTSTAGGVGRDLFEITAPSDGRIVLRKLVLGQVSDVGDAASEILPIAIITGSTASGSGGSTAQLALNVKSHSGAPTFGGSILRLNTTLASSGNVRHTDVMNIAAGYFYDPRQDERIEAGASERMIIRIPATPADPLTVYGTLTLETIGKGGF